ncbi:alpha/beta hydrolase family protein [Longitalea luteola]|uniref:alpha/beta hydrolase family protein n=1 Tax=Longitalea luteola TaxID=2812563 RepID=UPI001A97D1C9|nr:prolyl oligopeptidase family serine peptidase [Longitalea luteola]
MKKISFLFFIIWFCQSSYPQSTNLQEIPNSFTSRNKPVIDLEAIKAWPTLETDCLISSDGEFFKYRIENQPINSRTTIVASTETGWSKQLIGVRDVGNFTKNSKYFVFQNKDSLCYLKLGSDEMRCVLGVVNYKLVSGPDTELTLYMARNGDLVMYDLEKNEEKRFSSTSNYLFNDRAKVLILKTKGNEIRWFDLKSGVIRTIWKPQSVPARDASVLDWNIDVTGSQLLLLIKSLPNTFIDSDSLEFHRNSKSGNSIWYFSSGMDSAVIKINNKSRGIDSNLKIFDQCPSFTDDGRYILFKVCPIISSKINDESRKGVQVDVWSYKDSVLQIEQMKRIDPNSFANAVLNLTSKLVAYNLQNSVITVVEKEGEKCYGTFGDYGIVMDKMPIIEYWWPSLSDKSQWLVSLKDGSRKKLITNASYFFSPDYQYQVFFDPGRMHFYSQNLKTSKTYNISGDVPGDWFCSEEPHPFSERYPKTPLGIAGWLPEETAVLVFDNYDIWQLDLDGKIPPLNITGGRKKHIKFRWLGNPTDERGIVPKNKSLRLVAFNMDSKHNGFYNLIISKIPKLELLSMGPWSVCHGDLEMIPSDGFFANFLPLKAISKDVWIVKRESSSEAPNFFLTHDFKTFKKLTNLQPQMSYNWLTTELVTYRQLDGTLCQGVLYKPENFDPKKKYPLIFSIYEKFSQNLYQFPRPKISQDRINIPWYVSRGYLIFTPDIFYSVASESNKVVGDCAVNSVAGAAKYLSELPFIDKNKIGLQGHSFGGGETLYAITSTNVFAAACAAAPTVSNEISTYLGILRTKGKAEESKMLHSEIGHNKIGATLWERPDLYIRSSPVFRADKVSTPLLLIHNQNDGACDWNQGVEMYMALRRLQKKVWLLQYDSGDHSLTGKDALDYTIRVQQFFDYYLKKSPPANWMTKGVPLSLKGIDDGMKPDESGNIP